MKKINFSLLIICVISIFSAASLCSCEQKNKETSPTNKITNVEAVNPRYGDSLAADYAKYVSYKLGLKKLDTSMIETIPIYKDVGESYINTFKKQCGTQTYCVKIDRETLAFYYKYLLDNNSDTITFNFGKYDTTGFAAKKLVDKNYTSKFKDKNCLIMGAYDPLTKTNIPFRIPEWNYTFYDDWNDLQP
jgi:hypothetical protein